MIMVGLQVFHTSQWFLSLGFSFCCITQWCDIERDLVPFWSCIYMTTGNALQFSVILQIALHS